MASSFFSAADGHGSVDAWYSTASDFEEVLSGLSESHVHVFVADVVYPLVLLIVVFWISFLGSWDFLLGFVGFISVTMLMSVSGSSLPVVLVHLGPGMGAFLTGCPLSMIFIVALYLPWCKALESIPGVRPQLYADNLKCVSGSPAALLSAARFTKMYICLVGQKAAPQEVCLS